MSSKVVVDAGDIRRIVNAALVIFRETRYLPDDPKEAQVFLAISGLHSFLVSRGIEPNFSVKPVKEDSGDGTPLDDL